MQGDETRGLSGLNKHFHTIWRREDTLSARRHRVDQGIWESWASVAGF